MILELRHLRSLRAINETGNLMQAAERLHLTQSALSHQIKTLENYFDIALYQRQHKPLRLTAAGQRLLGLAEDILQQVETAEYELKRMAGHDSGRLHITIECHSCFEWLIPALDQYRKRWPEVEVDIRLGNNFDPMPSLRREDIDLVITSDPREIKTVRFEPLFEYEAKAIMANDHRLAQRQWLNPRDFTNETLITYPVATQRLDIFSHFLDPKNIRPAAVRQSELTAMILQLVASRRGIAVLPDWVLKTYLDKKYVTAKPLGKNGMHGTLYAAIREQQAAQEYLRDFITLARQGRYLKA